MDTATKDTIEELVNTGQEHIARERFGDRTVDDWFRGIGWDPDAARVALDALSDE